jgi:hypothetical protein
VAEPAVRSRGAVTGGADRGAHADAVACVGFARRRPHAGVLLQHRPRELRTRLVAQPGREGGGGLRRGRLRRPRMVAVGAGARRARGGVCRRRVQRGRRRAVDRSRGDATADRVERRVPAAARPWPACIARQDLCERHRLRWQSRVFLERLRTLLSLGGETGGERLRALLEPEGAPPSCRRGARSSSSWRRRCCSRGCSR